MLHGHVLMENRTGLIVDRLTRATAAERETALDMIEKGHRPQRNTVGADKGYDTGTSLGCGR